MDHIAQILVWQLLETERQALRINIIEWHLITNYTTSEHEFKKVETPHPFSRKKKNSNLVLHYLPKYNQ